MLILIGVDDSKHSRDAIEFVKKMSWPKGTQVTVVSAVREFIPAYTDVYVPAATYSEQLMEDEKRRHQEIVAGAEKSLRDASHAAPSATRTESSPTAARASSRARNTIGAPADWPSRAIVSSAARACSGCSLLTSTTGPTSP